MTPERWRVRIPRSLESGPWDRAPSPMLPAHASFPRQIPANSAEQSYPDRAPVALGGPNEKRNQQSDYRQRVTRLHFGLVSSAHRYVNTRAKRASPPITSTALSLGGGVPRWRFHRRRSTFLSHQQPSPLGRGCPATAFSSAAAGRVRGCFRAPGFGHNSEGLAPARQATDPSVSPAARRPKLAF